MNRELNEYRNICCTNKEERSAICNNNDVLEKKTKTKIIKWKQKQKQKRSFHSLSEFSILISPHLLHNNELKTMFDVISLDAFAAFNEEI